MKINIIIAVLFSLIFFSVPKNTIHAESDIQRIKNLLLSDDYRKDWIEVDLALDKGLYKSALGLVDKIYLRAKSENNVQNTVKAIIYKMKIKVLLNDNKAKLINFIQTEIDSSAFPVKPILQSILAEMYWTYYDRNRFSIVERTKVFEYNDKNILTWDLEKIVEEIDKCYKSSLEEADNLKKTNVELFHDILIYRFDYNGRKFRPSLYDFLVHRAIDFYINKEADLVKHISSFVIYDRAFFSPAVEFARMNIETTDSSSFEYTAIKLMQDATIFHLNDDNPEALIDLDIKRLNYLLTYSSIPDRDAEYFRAFENLENKYSKLPLCASIIYEKAFRLFSRDMNSPGYYLGEDYKWDLKKAYDFCQTAIEKYPESEGASKCKLLQKKITGKRLDNILIENNNLPDKPFKINVEYTNISKLYLRVVKTDFKEIAELGYDSKNNAYDETSKQYRIDYFKSKNPVHQFSVEIPDSKDYKNHTTEVMIPGLPPGEYAILTSTSEDFTFEKNMVSLNFTDISNISYIEKTKGNNFEFYVLHRETGEPLRGVKAQMYTTSFEYDKREYIIKKDKQFVTDENGYISLTLKKESGNFYFEFTKDNDYLCTLDKRRLSEYDYQSDGSFNPRHYRYAEEEDKQEISVHFFTDRKIYRPGQIVFFKGIILKKKGDKADIVPNTWRTVYLSDANGRFIDSIFVISNEFGTFNGKFDLPLSGLTGEYEIETDDHDSHLNFSVEEYKRPKFETTFDDVQGPYRLGDTIVVKGKTKTYSGSNISGATVRYHIKRKSPGYDYYSGSKIHDYLSGATVTNENGEFVIRFLALPDKKINKKDDDWYSFIINADVTDINGETRSCEKIINASYYSMNIFVDIPFVLNKNGNKDFEILSGNLSGKNIPSEGIIKIYKLKNPEKALRERLWKTPDVFIYSKEEYKKYFPDDVYDKENDYEYWERDNLIKEINFNTANDSLVHLDDLSSWQQGAYAIDIESKDPYGAEVKNSRRIIVYGENESELPYPVQDWIYLNKPVGEPGDDAKFIAGSSFKNVHMLYELEKKGKTIHKEWITLNNEKKVINVPVTEEYMGGAEVQLVFVSNNRLYKNNSEIYVPYSNKKLNISFESFRKKLQPGENEEWKIKIEGKNGSKTPTEMVAVLYDKSLDFFKSNSWDLSLHENNRHAYYWMGYAFSDNYQINYSKNFWSHTELIKTGYDELYWFGLDLPRYFQSDIMAETILIESNKITNIVSKTAGVIPDERDVIQIRGGRTNESIVIVDGVETTNPIDRTSLSDPTGNKKAQSEFAEIVSRKDFSETAFFYPELYTDSDGKISISFKVPEALTKWKMLGFAHTKDLQYGFIYNELITQKEFMVVPGAPRFFREGDKLSFTSKITNLSEKDLSGNIKLEFFDALTDKKIENIVSSKNEIQNFELKKGLSTSAIWELKIPAGVDAIKYKVVAKAENFSDGEEMVIPVLPNKTLVTESLPLTIRSNETKNYKFEKLINNNSSTLTNHNLTLEFTTNPVWYAIQSLPYLMEYPYECSEQIFSRYYANSMATYILNKDKKIKEVFETWQNLQPDALQSNLEKNAELKSVMLEETPWVREAKDEGERKKRIAALFDLKRMSGELNSTLGKLNKMQLPGGAFPWFEGMPADRYITQHIAFEIKRLYDIKGDSLKYNPVLERIYINALQYLDEEIANDYDRLLKLQEDGVIKLSDKNINSLQIHYLYVRSISGNYFMNPKYVEAYKYYKEQMKKYWLSDNVYTEGLAALAMFNFGDRETPYDILKSLKERAITDSEMGMYWNNMNSGYNRYGAPVETQAVMIEVFEKIAKDKKAVDEMKTWLLNQKQSQNWKTTKATVDACNALLYSGNNWLTDELSVGISLGNIQIDPVKATDNKPEAGTGYFKTSWKENEIIPSMGNVTLTKKNEGVSWGALYWQYFEQYDKISSAETNLKIDKKLYVQKITEKGKELFPLDENNPAKIGDVVVVRIILNSDRNLEYVHMKDLRASCFEPMDVLSGFKYSDGLGYYESMRDASMNFFFTWIPVGTHIFEYSLRVTHSGELSNGITTLQCMYAPEFSAHSEGLNIFVK